jgi:HSP20 family protein
MAIMRYTRRQPTYSPWQQLEEASNRLARLFDETPFSGGADAAAWMPAVNVQETKEELVLTAELPGIRQKDIQIELENNVLSISGEKSEERTEGDDDRRYHVWERRYGSFQRSFTLPRTVMADQISAAFDAGVLTVRLPKAPEAKGRRIEIASGSRG